MKITLYLETKILDFELPNEIEGSFSYDENPKSNSKLINIEAIDGAWNLYSTKDVSVLTNGNAVMNTKVQSNSFYNVKKDDKLYLIYVSDPKQNNILTYKYSQNTNMIIGNDENCNIKYNNNFINKAILCIKYEENSLVLSKLSQDSIYKNNKIVKNKKALIVPGDIISTYGINIIFLNNLFLINNPNNLLTIKEGESGIQSQIFSVDKNKSDIDIKDKELYKESEFFSKSPRIRRFIETKDINIDQPPRNNLREDMPLLLTIGPMLTMGATSVMMLANTIMRVNSGQTTYANSWPQIVTSIAMLASTLLWPNIIRWYSKHRQKKIKQETIDKYKINLIKKKNKLKEIYKL